MSCAPAIGDLVVYATPAETRVARVDLVRDEHVTGFPWRQGDRRWERGRHRIARRDLIAVLPSGADPAPIADHLNVLRNRRASERRQANRVHDVRVQRFLETLKVAG